MASSDRDRLQRRLDPDSGWKNPLVQSHVDDCAERNLSRPDGISVVWS